MASTIEIIKAEHRNYISVLHCIDGVIGDVERGVIEPDFALFRLALDYVSEFLDTYHHPKEDAQLFRLLRLRDPESAALLDRLEAEHRDGYEMMTQLRTALLAYEADRGAGPAFFEAMRAYHRLEWDHMRMEELEVIPRARAALTEADWAEIDAVFADHADPMFGDAPQEKFAGLLHRIAAMAPAPHGYGQPT